MAIFISKSQKAAVHWLEALPAQIGAWQRDRHRPVPAVVQRHLILPEIQPWKLDLLHSVTAESETPLSEGRVMGGVPCPLT
ncbi:DUF1698 domain-containing protein [Shigella flexneri]